MASRHCVAVAGAALIIMSIAACSGDDPPAPPATVSFPADPNKAPSVPNPIYPDAFVKKPCTSLTSEQRAKYNLDNGEEDQQGFPEACVFRYLTGSRWIRISYATNRPGLQDFYNKGPRGETRWEPQVLDGYPALATYAVDRIAVPSVPPSCFYSVGVNDLLYFSVLAQDADGSSECGVAKKIAADVLSTVKSNR